jgi:hypothetical protein
MRRLFLFAFILFLVGCGGYENEKINVENAKETLLLTPPCLKA